MTLFDADRVAALLEAEALDALVAISEANVVYASDLDALPMSMLGGSFAAVLSREPPHFAALVAPAAAESAIAGLSLLPATIVLHGESSLVDGTPAAVAEEAVHAVRERARRARSFEDARAAAFDGLPIDRARIATDEDPSGRLIWHTLRRVKHPAEVDRLRIAAGIAEEGAAAVLEACRAGTGWGAAHGAYGPAVVARGGRSPVSFSGAGAESALLAGPGSAVLDDGSLVRLDVCCSWQSYWADTGRTAVIGAAAADVEQRYEALRAGVEAALREARPGARLSRLYQATVDAVQGAGIPKYRRSHCGHSIGLAVYDGDLVAPDSDVPLEQGMVLNVEAPYYELGWGGMQLEETIVITQSGFESLTRLPRRLMRIDGTPAGQRHELRETR